MTQTDIDLSSDLEQLTHVQLTHVVDAPYIVTIVGKALIVRLLVVVAFPYARQTSNTERSQPDDIRGTHVVNLGSGPSAVVQLP